MAPHGTQYNMPKMMMLSASILMSTIASTGANSQVNFGIGNSRRLPSQVNYGIGNDDVTTLAIPNTLKATETPSTMAISFTTYSAMNTGSAGTGSVSDFITSTADSAVWNDAASGTCEVTLGGVAKTTTCAITTPTNPPTGMGGTVLTVTVGETIAPGAVVVTVKADFAANAAEGTAVTIKVKTTTDSFPRGGVAYTTTAAPPAPALCATLTADSTPTLAATCTGGSYSGSLIASASCAGTACATTDAAACCAVTVATPSPATSEPEPEPEGAAAPAPSNSTKAEPEPEDLGNTGKSLTAATACAAVVGLMVGLLM